ncbi:hypothetical protein ACFY2K_42595, partial [Kitasatospora sp. NPDC001309]|uniref:hypothetical protein n=1 Tax=Kitasatospora sp. NPDC001309 TaxID=3364013 RepID=UPI00369D0630
EATRLLDDLAAAAEKHGHHGGDAAGWLAQAAAEATSTKHHRMARTERTPAELTELLRALSDAFTELGLTVVPSQGGRGSVAVAPVPGGPTWGINETGLRVSLYIDGGWDLTVNQPQTRVCSIYAPTTEAGAREVAALVAAVLRGDAADPFRR